MSDRPTSDEVRSSTAETARSMTPQRVPVNSYETPGAYVVVAPLPAVTESDVTVELTADGLCFSAELRSAGLREYVLHEWEYGGYERHVEIPTGFGSDVEATLSNGQLVVRVLKGAFREPRRISPGAS
jgi:HSP20 family molecular chaperone IbpA